MNINRNNYEEFFLLYVDNELGAAERKAVEDFVSQNPDLNGEWETYLQTKLSPDSSISFSGKHLLFRDASEISLANYEEYFLSYIDGELNDTERKMVENFLEANSKLKSELDWMKRAKLDPADEIVFAEKHSLYRREEIEARVIVIKWWRVAAAASVILIAGLLWFNVSNRSDINIPIVAGVPKNTPAKPGSEKVESEKNNSSSNQPGSEPLENDISDKNNNQSTLANNGRNTSKKAREINKSNGDHIVSGSEIETKVVASQEIASAAAPKIETVQNVEANNSVSVSEQTKSKIEPTIIDVASGKEENNNLASNAVYKNDQGVTYLETDNPDKKPKGKIRTLFRKAARFVDRVTNPEFDEKKSVVRIANIQLGTQ